MALLDLAAIFVVFLKTDLTCAISFSLIITVQEETFTFTPTATHPTANRKWYRFRTRGSSFDF